MTWWHWYWAQVAGNIWAMPLQAVVAFTAGVLFRRPLAAWWHRHSGVKADLADIRAVADAAHRIAADLHERLTGERHPDAPAKRGEGT